MSPAKRKSRAGRPTLASKGGVARTILVTLKLLPSEATLLDKLAAAREMEIAAATGGGRVRLSRSSILRELLDAEVKRRGIQ